EIVLDRPHAAIAIAVLEGETAGFYDHLIECVIPAHAELFAVAAVFGGNGVEARVEVGGSGFDQRHEAAGRYARGNAVVLRGFDGGEAARGSDASRGDECKSGN